MSRSMHRAILACNGDDSNLSPRGQHRRARAELGFMVQRRVRLDRRAADIDLTTGLLGLDVIDDAEIGFPADTRNAYWPALTIEDSQEAAAVAAGDDDAEPYFGIHPTAATYARAASRVEVVRRRSGKRRPKFDQQVVPAPRGHTSQASLFLQGQAQETQRPVECW